MADIKRERAQWLARVYSSDADALGDDAANSHLFDRLNDFGMDHFIANFRPLTKLRAGHGDLHFELGALTHEAPDLSFAEFLLDGEVCFEVRIRFEPEPPHRIQYWGSYKPLPEGVEVRRYRPNDAAGCVALERACPMELADGSRWVVDRGGQFNDYLKLMGPVDAAVVTANAKIIGFFSCALRPIHFKGSDTYSVYQHHYRVHPEHRAGNVSHALANFVDPRRSFQTYEAQFPYSLVDPNNLHMQNVGFPEAEGIRVARISIPVSVGVELGLMRPNVNQICDAMNGTHGDRELYQAHDPERLADRWSRVATYTQDSYRVLGANVLGVWQVNELNVVDKSGAHEELRLSFALDYGFADENEFETLVRGACFELEQSGTTHLSFMCDTRASEYELLRRLSDDEQQFAVHTLPWIVPDLKARTLYCDAVYS